MLALNTLFLCRVGKYFYDFDQCHAQNEPEIKKSRILSGHYDDLVPLNNISKYMKRKFNNSKKGLHMWTETLKNDPLYSDIEQIRTSDIIIDKIKEIYPDCRIVVTRQVDEVYWAVSPAEAKNSDRSLVDCHYDGPLAAIDNGVSFYRIIISCNENTDVTTSFPNDDIHVKMTTGDFHGLDMHKDYHCVVGSIPPNKHRVLMKMHYLIVPNKLGKGSNSELITKYLNIKWMEIGRYSMNISAEPKTPFEYLVGNIVDTSRKIFNKL